jgi:hypothetical protein
MNLLARHQWAVACVLLVAVLYGPFLLQGGPVVDDWSILNAAQDHPGLVPAYTALFDQFSNRPGAPLVFSIASNLFSDRVWMYILLDVLLWLSAIALLSRIIARQFDVRLGWLFFVFASIPALSSTVIFSPAVLLMGSASVLLWSLSLYCLTRHLKDTNRWMYACAYLLLLLSVLTYEASLPLFVITVCWPYVLNKDSQFLRSRGYLLRYVLPVAIVLLLVLLYQKAIIPQFVGDISRLRFRGLVIVPAVLSKFLLMITVDAPLLLLTALKRLSNINIGTIGGIFAAVLLLARAARPVPVHLRDSGLKRLAWILGLSAASTIGLYILAGTVPTIYGYDNRGLIGFGISVAGLLALGTFHGFRRRPALFYGMLGLLALMSLSFSIQRDNYIRSSKLQSRIFEDLTRQVTLAKIPAGDTVLVDVPTYLAENYSNEAIFSDELDAKVSYASGAQEKAGVRLTKRRLEFGRARIEGDMIVSDDTSVPIAQTWYYHTDHALTSSVAQIRGAEHLREILDSIRAQPAPPLPVDAWKEVVGWYVEHINVPDLRAQYQQYRARWGYN